MLFANLKKSIHNSTIRLVFLYLTLFVISSIVLLSFIYWSTVSYIFKQLDQHIEYDNDNLKSLYITEGEERLIGAINERIDQSSYESIYLLYKKNGEIIAGNFPYIPPEINAGWHIISLNEIQKSTVNHSARILVTPLTNDLFLLNGLDIESAHKQEHMIFNSLAAGIAVVLLLGAIGGFIISISTIKKINLINKTIHDIHAGDLSIRIPSKGIDDEYDLLSDNINQMLDQIHKLMNGMNNLSNNVAHELRTPLTRLRGRLELIEKADSPCDKEDIHEAINDVDTILSTFNALLRISNVENGTQRGIFSTIKINSLLMDLVSFYEPVAHDKGISITLKSSNSHEIFGDRDMIFQAINNLVDNSIKYMTTPGMINIETKLNKNMNMMEIIVSDTGSGISDADKIKVFEPFYRSNIHMGYQGNGLGLSLVMAIVMLHKGSVELGDNHPGLVVSIKLPIK
ncbi:MAG: HAMP domain-containing histidine kinase [Gammaproteobacteria bacterium]|nr:HAMP domain-containing histidine kinase [Gammaproteobacteria bacterium]